MKNKDNTNTKNVLLRIKPFPVANYITFDLDRLVVYTIYALEEKI